VPKLSSAEFVGCIVHKQSILLDTLCKSYIEAKGDDIFRIAY